MIAPWPLGASAPEVELGDAVFSIDGSAQHAGIAESKGAFSSPISVYSITGANSLLERWSSEDRWQLTVLGRLGKITHLARQAVAGRVLRECRDIADLLEGRRDGISHKCCWQIRYPSEFIKESETVVFSGSCAGFVEHCFEKAGVVLINKDKLPQSTPQLDEYSYIQKEYEKAGGVIKRLYPSYQIRAFQLEEYPWEPDIAFRFFPEGF